MDIDDNTSHVEGSTAVMSAGESESESETDIVDATESDITETPYIPQNENEFGAVSAFNAMMCSIVYETNLYRFAFFVRL